MALKQLKAAKAKGYVHQLVANFLFLLFGVVCLMCMEMILKVVKVNGNSNVTDHKSKTMKSNMLQHMSCRAEGNCIILEGHEVGRLTVVTYSLLSEKEILLVLY